MQMPFSSTMSRNPSATILALSNTSTSSSALHSQITKPNKTQIWNIQMRELAKQGLYQQGINLCRQMLRSGTTPNASSFPFPLKSCTILSLPLLGKQIHGQTVKTGLEHHPLVLTSLVSMYSKWYEIGSASKVFGKSPLWVRDTICYNSLLAGYSYNSKFCETVSLFCEMRGAGVSLNSVTMLGLIPVFTQPEHLCFGMSVHGCSVKFGLDYDMSVANCLLSMYVRCGSVELARKLFDGMSDKGLITWNAMISGYAQNGLANEVLDLYREMKVCGVCPDEVTLLGVLSSCAHLGAQSIGREVEERMALGGFGSNPFLQNSLINMYARCGNLLKARALFDDMPAKSIITWTAIIGGYGLHGHGKTAVDLFDKMIKTGIRPDGAVFVSVLSACSHAGLTDKGLDYFNSMDKIYGIQPGVEHYACIIDLLGRAGRFDQAKELIGSMKIKPDGAVWGALLGACKIHKNVELAKSAFEKVIELEPKNIGYYVLMSNLYADVEDLDGVSQVRVLMRERKLRKDPGCSYVEFKGKIHLFYAGDKNHPQTKQIYQMLDELEGLVKQLSGPNKHDKEREKKNVELITGMGVHSEKLAVVFGLLNSEAGTDIVVIKNLRVCGDCHSFMKIVSKIVDRQLVIRDPSRFHHFKNGACSCNDYW